MEIARYALEALNIDRYGLDEIDNKILCTIIDKFKGVPVGLTTIATALGEDRDVGRSVRAILDKGRFSEADSTRTRSYGAGL